MLDYKIISTGSKGNCVIIEDIMIDCGVPFKDIKDELYNIKVLLLTHIHSDHINKSTLNKIQKLFPHIEIFGNYEVYQSFPDSNVRVVNATYPFKAGEYEITPFECVHDVLCYGYVWEVKDQDVIYATDTSTLEHAPNQKYDWFFIESNFSEEKLSQIASNYTRRGYDPVKNAMRHLSSKQAKTFYYLYRRNYASP